MKLFLRWLIIAVALVIASYVIPGIEVGENGWVAVLATAAILGVINIFIKPLLTLLSCGFVALTLGLFLFVINAFCLWLASWVAVNWFDLPFYVNGFWPALWGSIVVSAVSFVLNMFVPD